MDDGRELPLYKLETTSESHPFYTGTQKSVDSLGGRVEKFRNKFAHLGAEEVRHRAFDIGKAAAAAFFVAARRTRRSRRRELAASFAVADRSTDA